MELAQISWADLLMGDGTPYVVQTVSGLHDTPGVRSGRTNRARAHGSFPGSKYLEPRVLTATIDIDGNHNEGDVYDAFSRAHIVASSTDEFRAKVPGVAGGREILIWASCERLSLPTNQDYMAGIGRADVQWVADDPRIYDSELITLNTAVADTAGTGEAWPFVWPIDWGGRVSGGVVTADNEGEFGAPWVATIYGPITNPRIELGSTGEFIRLDATLAAGEYVTIDSLAGTVLLGGTVDRDTWVRTGSSWFELPPGSNTVRFAATAGTGSMSFSFRSTWI